MSTLKLFLLGSPRLERDGVPVDLARRKNVALLAYLAITDTSHTRKSLITLRWPKLEPSLARASPRDVTSFAAAEVICEAFGWTNEKLDKE